MSLSSPDTWNIKHPGVYRMSRPSSRRGSVSRESPLSAVPEVVEGEKGGEDEKSSLRGLLSGALGGGGSGGGAEGGGEEEAGKRKNYPWTFCPGQWLDAIPAINQEAMADANFGEGSSFEGMTDVSTLDLKLEQQSPTNTTPSGRFSFSRTSSTGSVHAISCSSASSAHNTDDEDSDGTTKPALSYKDRRREAHTMAEQKRRDAIKKGYEELQHLVPTCQQSEALGAQKLSKAAILQRSIDYIQFLLQQKKKQEDDLDNLRKEVMALKIMKANYEHIVKAHQNTPQHGHNQVSDEAKFQVFQQVMDTLFQSFNASISVANFAELSGCVFSWLEEYCKPQTLREVTLGILRQLNSQLNH